MEQRKLPTPWQPENRERKGHGFLTPPSQLFLKELTFFKQAPPSEGATTSKQCHGVGILLICELGWGRGWGSDLSIAITHPTIFATSMLLRTGNHVPFSFSIPHLIRQLFGVADGVLECHPIAFL